jgi:hypothetical protein
MRLRGWSWIVVTAVLFAAGLIAGVWWVHGLLHGVFALDPFLAVVLAWTGLMIVGDES